jgi:uncharacterized protein YbjT (DUF2867 family)
MADISGKAVTVFGGSGFIGRHVVKRLAAEGHVVRVAVRDTDAALYLKVMGKVGHIVPIRCNVCDETEVARAVAGAEWVVNLTGILAPMGRQTFERVHVEGPELLAKTATKEGVHRLVHMSALGADANSQSHYARSKAEGEARVLAAFPKATILRPSVVFGPEDRLFNLFAELARFSPALPVLGASWCGQEGTLFQPVYVGDVAEAIVNALKRMESEGQTYELGGPEVMSAKAMMENVVKHTGRKRWLVPAPFWLLSLEATFLGLLPGRPLTLDQVRMLWEPNVLSGKAKGLADLGVNAKPAGAILPSYLSRYRLPRPPRTHPA